MYLQPYIDVSKYPLGYPYSDTQMGRKTGEHRKPKKGEWYIHDNWECLQATEDMDTCQFIAEIVNV